MAEFRIEKPTLEEVAAGVEPFAHAAVQIREKVRECRKLARKGSAHLAVEGLCDLVLGMMKHTEEMLKDDTPM